MNELNLGICNYAITQFYCLLYGGKSGKPLIGDDAYKFDLQFITHEQGVVALPIYAKTNSKTISRFQEVADNNWTPSNFAADGAAMFNDVTPAFSKFNAKVTETQFRIDLPLLMLWLDRHIPLSPHLLNKYGKVDESIKKKIRTYYNQLIFPKNRP